MAYRCIDTEVFCTSTDVSHTGIFQSCWYTVCDASSEDDESYKTELKYHTCAITFKTLQEKMPNLHEEKEERGGRRKDKERKKERKKEKVENIVIMRAVTPAST